MVSELQELQTAPFISLSFLQLESLIRFEKALKDDRSQTWCLWVSDKFDVFLCASMFHVLEELFDFKWEFARGREGKPSPRVSQPPSFLHYVFNFGLLDLLGESFRKLRCRVQVTRAAITMHTSAKSQKLCAAKKQCVNILICCIFEIFWYDFPNGKAIVLQSCLAESRSLLCF